MGRPTSKIPRFTSPTPPPHGKPTTAAHPEEEESKDLEDGEIVEDVVPPPKK